jgi:ribonuclease-3
MGAAMDAIDPAASAKDPKTLLQEHLQGRKLALPQYSVIATRGEAHEQQFQVECVIPELAIRSVGEGGSRRSAEQEAARQAYELATRG